VCVIPWFIDASFAVHTDMKSHMCAIMACDEGAAQVMLTKLKINTHKA
jgi:hypothetical protein